MTQSHLGNPPRDPTKVLEQALEEANQEYRKDKGANFLASLNGNSRKWIEAIGRNSTTQKAIVSALTTSLAKKIEDPKQDVRSHKVELPQGYSGRTFDTKYVTPFFKKHFPGIAMKESGWLTRSIEQAHPFTIKPLFPGKIRDTQVKDAFLRILDDLEANKADPHRYLVALFIILVYERSQLQTLIKETIAPLTEDIQIDRIVFSLRQHFFGDYHSPGASKLPTIAIYAIYHLLVAQLLRFENKKLLPMKSHVAPDMRAGEIGDVEILDENGDIFEAVEVKHNIHITPEIIRDSYRKFKNKNVKRYYLLSTAEPPIDVNERREVIKAIQNIRKEHGCEVIVDGILQSLGYYLRLINMPSIFLKNYTTFLKIDIMRGAEIKAEHLKEWKSILKTIYEQ